MEIIIWVFAGLCVLVLILSGFFLIPFLVGAPYEPSLRRNLGRIVELSEPKDGDRIAELGSGDGIVCIKLAEAVSSRNIEVHGYELNPILVWISRYRVRKRGLKGKVFIHWKNLFNGDLSKFNKIVLFQFRTIMSRLSKKFNNELRSGSRIVSREWKLPGWSLKNQLGKVYLYEV